MHRVTAELIASGAAQRAKKAGDVAPSFALKDPEGNIVSSDKLLKKGSLVVSFYRGVWCPYCNMELQALEAAQAGVRQVRRLAACDLAACHEETHGPQQLPALFDHLVGAQQERFRYRGAERLGGFEIDD
jgi:hypothetical protein